MGAGRERFNIDLIAHKLASECLSETQRPTQQKRGSFAHVWPYKRLFVHEAERGSWKVCFSNRGRFHRKPGGPHLWEAVC